MAKAKCKDKAKKEHDDAIKLLQEQMALSSDELLTAYKNKKPTKERVDRLIDIGENVPPELMGKRVLGPATKYMQGLHTSLINHENLAVRGLTSLLFEAPQGGHAMKETASILSHIFKREIIGASRGRISEGVRMFVREEGKKWYHVLSPSLNTRFKKEVYKEVHTPGTSNSPGVQHAAEGVRDSFELGGSIQHVNGVVGFEKHKVNRNYIPIIPTGAGVADTLALSIKLHGSAGKKVLVEAMTKAYMLGDNKLTEGSAMLVARGQIDRALSSNLSMRDSLRAVKNSDLEKLEEEMRRSGFTEEAITDFLDSAMSKERRANMSNRAKHSLKPDITVKHMGLEVADMFESDVEKLVEAYARDAAGASAMARVGFESRTKIEDTLIGIEKAAADRGEDAGEAIDMLREGIEMIHGRSIDEAPEGFLKGVAALRGWTAFLRLQNVGWASATEPARSIVNRGISISLANIPSLRDIMLSSNHLREGGMGSGKLLNPVHEQADFIMRYVGDDQIMDFRGIATDTLEEASTGKWGRILDSALAQGQYIESFTSGFRAIQGSGEKLATRSLLDDIRRSVLAEVDGAARSSNISELQVNEAGWGDGFLDRFKDWAKKSIKEVEFEGVKHRLIDYEKMPPEDLLRFKIGVYRTMKREMQGMFVGESSPWMNKWLGKFITQFRAFQIASLEKQLLRDGRFAPAVGAQIAVTSAALGLATHSLYVMVKSTGMSGDERQKFLEENYSPLGLFLGTFTRMGQLASVGLMTDFMATAELMPEELVASGTSSGARTLTQSSIPVFGMLGDAKDAVVSPVQALKGDIDVEQAATRLQKVVFGAQTMPLQQALNQLKHLEE